MDSLLKGCRFYSSYFQNRCVRFSKLDIFFNDSPNSMPFHHHHHHKQHASPGSDKMWQNHILLFLFPFPSLSSPPLPFGVLLQHMLRSTLVFKKVVPSCFFTLSSPLFPPSLCLSCCVFHFIFICLFTVVPSSFRAHLPSPSGSLSI